MFAEGEILTGVQQQRHRDSRRGGLSRRGDRGRVPTCLWWRTARPSRRGVRIGRETDSKLEITDGLKPGDLLVAEQRIELAEGVRVEPGK